MTRAFGRKWTFTLAAGLLCMSAASGATGLSVDWTDPDDDVTLSVSAANASVFTAHVSRADTMQYTYDVEYYISSPTISDTYGDPEYQTADDFDVTCYPALTFEAGETYTVCVRVTEYSGEEPNRTEPSGTRYTTCSRSPCPRWP